MHKHLSALCVAVSLIGGCEPHGRTYIVEYQDHSPPAHQNARVVEEITVVETYETNSPSTCSPVLEQHYAPYYHTPDWCTDWGPDVGYCCTWHYIHQGGDCADEWCYWEDTCNWEPVAEECVYERYEYEYY